MNIYLAWLGIIAWYLYPLLLFFGCLQYISMRPNGLLMGSYLTTTIMTILAIWVRQLVNPQQFDAYLVALHWGLLAAPFTLVGLVIGFRKFLRTVDDWQIKAVTRKFVFAVIANIGLMYYGSLMLFPYNPNDPFTPVSAFMDVLLYALPGGYVNTGMQNKLAFNVCVLVAVVSYAIGFWRAKQGPILHTWDKKARATPQKKA